MEWGSSTWRGGVQKVQHVPRVEAKENETARMIVAKPNEGCARAARAVR